MGRRWRTVCVAALLLAACNLVGRDPRLDVEVRSVFDLLRNHQDQALAARLAPRLRTPGAAAGIAAAEGSIPPGEPRGRKVVATSTVRAPGAGETVSASDAYDYGDRKLLVVVRLHRDGAQAPWQVEGLQLQAATAQEDARNALTLKHKSAVQYLFLAFVVASPLLMVLALTKVLDTPGLSRRWLWGVLAFVGVGSLHMNWTTGQLTLQPLTLVLIGATAERGASPFSPWMLGATLPVGALLLLAGAFVNDRRAQTTPED